MMIEWSEGRVSRGEGRCGHLSESQYFTPNILYNLVALISLSSLEKGGRGSIFCFRWLLMSLYYLYIHKWTFIHLQVAFMETEHQVKGALLLDVVVREGASILQMLAGKDQTLPSGGCHLLESTSRREVSERRWERVRGCKTGDCCVQNRDK